MDKFESDDKQELIDLEEDLKFLQDSFLDAYSKYLKVHTEFSKNILKRKIIELEICDKTFEFKMEDM